MVNLFDPYPYKIAKNKLIIKLINTNRILLVSKFTQIILSIISESMQKFMNTE